MPSEDTRAKIKEVLKVNPYLLEIRYTIYSVKLTLHFTSFSAVNTDKLVGAEFKYKQLYELINSAEDLNKVSLENFSYIELLQIWRIPEYLACDNRDFSAFNQSVSSLVISRSEIHICLYSTELPNEVIENIIRYLPDQNITKAIQTSKA